MATNIIEFLKTIGTDVKFIRDNFEKLDTQNESKLTELERSLRTAFGQADQNLTKQISDLGTRVTNYERRITGLESNIRAFNTFSVTASTKIQTFETDIDELKKNKPVDYSGTINNILSNIGDINNRLSDTNSTVTRLNESNTTLSRTTQNHDKDITEIKNQINVLGRNSANGAVMDSAGAVTNLKNGRSINLKPVIKNSIISLHAGNRLWGPNPKGSPIHERLVSYKINTNEIGGLIARTLPIPFCQNRDFFSFNVGNYKYKITYLDERMEPVNVDSSMILLRGGSTKIEPVINENEFSFELNGADVFLVINDPVVESMMTTTGYLIIEVYYINSSNDLELSVDLISDRLINVHKLENNFLQSRPTQYIGFEGDTIPYKGGVAYVKKHLQSKITRTRKQGSNTVIYFDNPKGNIFSSGSAVGLDSAISGGTINRWFASVQESAKDHIIVNYTGNENYTDGYIYITEFEYIENGSV